MSNFFLKILYFFNYIILLNFILNIYYIEILLTYLVLANKFKHFFIFIIFNYNFNI